MSIDIPHALTENTDYEPLKAKQSRYGHEITLRPEDLTDGMLAAISAACRADLSDEKKTKRVVDAIIAAREGDTKKKIPNLHAAPEMIMGLLRNNISDGWIYQRREHGHLAAWLVTSVKYNPGTNNGPPYVSMSMTANGRTSGSRGGEKALGLVTTSQTFYSDSITNKRVVDMLTNAGLYVETDELRAEYDRGLAKYVNVLADGFSEQYRYTGTPAIDGYDRDREGLREGHKVIHDINRTEAKAPSDFTKSVLFLPINAELAERAAQDEDVDPGTGAIPTHFDLRVFDLHVHDFIWVNTNDIERYVYDKTLTEKIVLPEDQRNLLDILTSGLDNFTGDVVEGKSAGNVILCKGAPGVGKTLTAEVYSEVIERPLYSIHSGNLGVSADDVRKNLETAFKRAKRWNAVLLLDEADVFVLERGNNITQNAIVAEFLRTLEYFTGLMFMTTNRADNIDDAILSRAAAIIDYKVPGTKDIRAIWQVQATNQGTVLSNDLLDELVYGFKTITPRDVKMLLRLALRVSAGTDTRLNADVFASCAMFRGLHFEPGSREEDAAVAPRRIRKKVVDKG